MFGDIYLYDTFNKVKNVLGFSGGLRNFYILYDIIINDVAIIWKSEII